MKVLCGFVFGSLFGAAVVSAAVAVARSETDPVKISPQYYTVFVRIAAMADNYVAGLSGSSLAYSFLTTE